MTLIKHTLPQNMSNQILKQMAVTLLLHSQAIEEFPWLKTLLKNKEVEGHPCLTGEDAASLSSDKHQFLQNSLDDLVNTSSDEWECETNDIQEDGGEGNKDCWVRCALCNTRNRWVFFIVNKLNGNRLNVGSSCIKLFGIDTGGKSMSQLKQEASKLRWVNEIDQKIPGVKRLNARWDDHLNTYPILIPASYDERFRELGKRFRICFEQYTDSKSNHNADDLATTVQKLKQILKDSELIKAEMAEYSRTHENDIFAATRNVVKWLQRQSTAESQVTINWLKKDGGTITARTAHRITEPGFMHSIVPNLNDHLRNVGFQVRSVDDNQRGYVLTTTEKPVIELFISHKNLLWALGRDMFENAESVEHSEVIKHCAIANPKSRDIVRAALTKSMKNYGYSEISLSGDFESIREEFDEWVLSERSSKRIVVVEKISRILDRYVAGMTQEEIVNNYLASGASRYSRDSFQELYSDRSRNQ